MGARFFSHQLSCFARQWGYVFDSGSFYNPFFKKGAVMKFFMSAIMLGFGGITMTVAGKTLWRKDLPSAAIFAIVGVLAIFLGVMVIVDPQALLE